MRASLCANATTGFFIALLLQLSALAYDSGHAVTIPGLLHLQYSRQQQSNASLPVLSNTTLDSARELVKASQAESRERNLRLLGSPRHNSYEPRFDAVEASGQLQQNGTLAATTSEGTGVNGTVAVALALVAEADAGNASTTAAAMGKRAGSFWMENMVQNGASPFAPSGYKVWRNVKEYGAVGDGVHDDTDAINKAISDGNRCGADCGSSTSLQAAVYFPAGTYLVSRSIVAYYFTQLIGDPTNMPVIKVAPSFSGLGVISSNAYIDGGDGASWYINQNNFYRQVRNFVIDMTAGPKQDYIAGLHWQVAQATSLQNIKFKMSTAAANNQQGIFMENGSGGFMSDLEFTGGSLGAYVGNQQFTVRNLKFSGQSTRAIEIHWDWGWTWKGLQIDNCPIGIMITGPDSDSLGSAIFLDSSFTNVNTGLQLQAPGTGYGKITVNLFNVATANVANIVKMDSGKVLLSGSSGTQTTQAWGVGKRYDTRNGEDSGVWQDGAHYERFPEISPALLSGGKFLERSKPQYENLGAGSFVNLKQAYGAAGDGKTDDTGALNAAFRDNAVSGKVLWIPAGVYLVSDTVKIPPGVKVVGQLWPQIMGAGAKFADIGRPQPVVQVGSAGDVGHVEIQELLFTVRGATAGAVVLQWNMHEASPGSAAMWDTHIRVGGALGSGLQAADCPKLTGKVNENCIAAAMLVHVTKRASAYFENNWFWVADHDLDVPAQTQIDVYVARGVLIESTGPVWLYGTASEHCVLYQYQVYNASTIFMGMIQTESPYYQIAPPAPEPFPKSDVFPADPSWDYCDGSSINCAFSWGVRVLNSANIYVYGAGLYSWFNQYDQACVKREDCQDRIFEISSSSAVWIYSLITKASVEMISPSGGLSVLGKDNKISYCDIVMAWMGSVSGEGAIGGGIHRSPASATVIPFPATTVKPTETFTIKTPVVSQVDYSYNDGNQNMPPGPGRGSCERCDLSRLITSTCCGVDGGVSNPVEIAAGVPIPRSLFLPPGFVPNQRITGSGGEYEAGVPLPREVLIPIGTAFPVPFILPPGLPLSNTWSPEAWNSTGNGTMFLPDAFWDTPPHTVSCTFPCTIRFPPIITSTTWTPPVITYKTQGQTTTTTIPPHTTEKIRISKTTILRSKPTQTIRPVPAKKPLCLYIPLIRIKICPPSIIPFPPPPVVTIIPIPPGGKPGPTTPDNEPTPDEQEEEEEEDDEEERTCPAYDSPDDDGESGDGGDYNGVGMEGRGDGGGGGQGPGDYTTTFKGAGFGSPTTVTITVAPTSSPAKTTPTPTTSYTYSYGKQDETTVICERTTSVTLSTYTFAKCTGSVSTTISTTTTPAPAPQQTVAWSIYKKTDRTIECVASRCSHSYTDFSVEAGTPKKPCKAKAKDLSYGTPDNKNVLVGAADVMIFEAGVCRGPGPYTCRRTEAKGSTWKCHDKNGSTESTCTLLEKGAEVDYCFVHSSDTSYDTLLKCTSSFESLGC